MDFEWVSIRSRRKALAGDDLKNIAGADIRFRFANGGKIFGFREIGMNAERTARLGVTLAR